MLCSEATLVKLDFDGGTAVTLKCRAWSCPICQPERGRALRGLAFSGKPTTFITLTVNPANFDSPEERARRLADAWRTIVREAKAKYGYKTIPYLCVFEATKAGEPHLHIIARVRWLDQKWLSKRMDALMGAPIVDIRRVWRAKQVASYITKYVGKDPHRFGTCKRYWCTQDWEQSEFIREEDPILVEGKWDTDSRDITSLQADWEFAGWYCWIKRGTLYGTTSPPF